MSEDHFFVKYKGKKIPLKFSWLYGQSSKWQKRRNPTIWETRARTSSNWEETLACDFAKNNASLVLIAIDEQKKFQDLANTLCVFFFVFVNVVELKKNNIWVSMMWRDMETDMWEVNSKKGNNGGGEGGSEGGRVVAGAGWAGEPMSWQRSMGQRCEVG